MGVMRPPQEILLTALLEVEQEANGLWPRLTETMKRHNPESETDITRNIIEEIVCEHPEWHDAMEKVRSRREIPLEPVSKEMSSPGTPKVTVETISDFDARRIFADLLARCSTRSETTGRRTHPLSQMSVLPSALRRPNYLHLPQSLPFGLSTAPRACHNLNLTQMHRNNLRFLKSVFSDVRPMWPMRL
jgi:hypothetical protein